MTDAGDVSLRKSLAYDIGLRLMLRHTQYATLPASVVQKIAHGIVDALDAHLSPPVDMELCVCGLPCAEDWTYCPACGAQSRKEVSCRPGLNLACADTPSKNMAATPSTQTLAPAPNASASTTNPTLATKTDPAGDMELVNECRKGLVTISEENDRARRQFVNVSNNRIEAGVKYAGEWLDNIAQSLTTAAARISELERERPRGLPVCAVSGRIAGDAFACGDCDPCGATSVVPEVVKSLLRERDDFMSKFEAAALARDELERERDALKAGLELLLSRHTWWNTWSEGNLSQYEEAVTRARSLIKGGSNGK